MTDPLLCVRELEVCYKPGRVALPVGGDVTTPRAAATLAAGVLADLTVEQVIALHVIVTDPCDGGAYYSFCEAGALR